MKVSTKTIITVMILCVCIACFLAWRFVIYEEPVYDNTTVTVDAGKIQAEEKLAEEIPVYAGATAYTEQRRDNYCFDEGCDCERSVHKAWFWDNPEVTVVWVD